LALGALLGKLWGCGSSGDTPSDGGVPPGGGGRGTTGAGGGGDIPITGGLPCSDLFDPGMLRTYAIEIDPAELAKVEAELNDVVTLEARGNDFVARHPVVFRMGGETVTDATLKLHGQSSWAQTVKLDGARAKMQFDISFHQRDPKGRFHGVAKLVFDMPRGDWTFLHDRLAHTWLRQAGIAVGCAANARVEINGAYYGLFVAKENTAKRIIEDYFPGNADGDLWKAGNQPQTNQEKPNWERQKAFARASTTDEVAAIVDLESSIVEWAAEALLNNGDGAYGGNHNFYIYDQGTKGFVFLPNDTDATFEWMTLFDKTPYDAHPIYWWTNRAQPAPAPTAAWVGAMSDPSWRRKYAEAIEAQIARWDVAQLQGWIDRWSQQIADAVASDPRAAATPDQFRMAVAAARETVARRRDFLQGFVDCVKNGTGQDVDGDGVRWCEDCRDDDPAVRYARDPGCQ
jgi:CotH kinase protein